MLTCGIDPGQKGGFAIIDRDIIDLAIPIPVFDKRINVPELVLLLSTYQPKIVKIEQQAIRPMQGGAMAIGSNYGRILAAVEYLGLPHKITTPAAWNKKAGIPKGLKGRPKKEASFARAQQLWGNEFARTGLKPTQDGPVEALLIAYFG